MSWWSDPRLAECRRIFVREMIANARIDARASEKIGAQRVGISVDMFVPLAVSTPHHDKLAEVVDYNFIRDTVLTRIAQGHVNLQETLVDELTQSLLAHPAAVAVRVSCRKLDAYSDARSVGVEVFRFKS